MSDDLWRLDAGEALRLLTDGELSPVELIDDVIARAEATEPHVNAIMHRRFDEARDHARGAADRYVRGEARPLDGLLIAIKDEMDIDGQPMTNGSALLADNVSHRTEIGTQRLLDAGAIVHARTTTPEFSMCGYCSSDLHGVTRNPWNLEVTPGGSSGGSGAVVADGAAMMASGSDIGGSIRIPAALCGVVGYKPPKGRVPSDSEWTYDLYSHDHGPLARSVADAIRYTNVIAGPSPFDPLSLPDAGPLPLEPADLRGVRIALSMDLGFKPVEADVRREVEAAARRFEDAGATVESVDLPWTREDEDTSWAHYAAGMDLLLFEQFGEDALRTRTSPTVRFVYRDGSKADPAAVLRERRTRYRMSQDLAKVHAEFDLLLCPTSGTTRLAADMDPFDTEVRVNGVVVEPTIGWAMTVPFNMLSSCPVWAVPTGGLADNGVPVGIQLIGRPYADASLARIALAWDEIRPGPGWPEL